MCELGISIYPEHSTKEKDFKYMEMASAYGFTKIFTCLLSVKKEKEEIIKEYKEYVQKAHELGFTVMVDTAPSVITHLGASPLNLQVFHDIGFDCIRLDMSFGPLFDGIITQNPYGIEIAFNGSNDAGISLLLEHGANKEQMSICHNFFPQPYTALDTQKFRILNKKWSQFHLPITTFITSNTVNTFGPWPLSYGLCTLENNRFLPIETQLRHMIMEKNIHTCIIGNAYATEEELACCAKIKEDIPTFYIHQAEGLCDLEKSLLYDTKHQGRFDCGDYMIRSVFPRLLIKESAIPSHHCEKEIFQRGDVVIVNEKLKHYQGEVQIILKPMKNLSYHNYVGQIISIDQNLLDYYKEECGFSFQPYARKPGQS